MQRVLSANLWKTVRDYAEKASQRRAAIAFVTKDLIGFREGDVLVVNASRSAIAAGETCAKLLRKMHECGVKVYSCPDLHAKALCLGEIAFIGSSNMSKWADEGSIEVGVLTDHPSTVAGIAAFIMHLIHSQKPLEAREIEQLCSIEVIRGGAANRPHRKKLAKRTPDLGTRTWLVGMHDLPDDPPSDEQRAIDSATAKLRAELHDPEFDPDWVRTVGNSRFVRECKPGDLVIQICRTPDAKKPYGVYRHTPVLLKQRGKRWTRFYWRDSQLAEDKLTWSKFQRLIKRVGEARPVKPGSCRELDSDVAEALARSWRAMAKAK